MRRESPGRKDGLQPIDPFALLERLKLSTGKAAEFCGVSRRQLCYWTDIGLVSASEEDPGEEGGDAASRRVYDFPALYKIMLIKQVLSRVKGLRRAAKEINDFLQQRSREAEELRTSIDKKREDFLSHQAGKLDALSRQIREALARSRGREELFPLSESLAPLRQLADAISSGSTVLEENPAACLRLASLLEQAEARLAGLSAD